MKSALVLMVVVASMMTSACASRRLPASPAPPGVEYLSRDQWGANPPVLAMEPHDLNAITIHHTATRRQPARPLLDKLRGLQRFSQSQSLLASGRTKPVWADIPYHFYIDHAGRVAEARTRFYVGDTNTSYDPTGHLLIVLEGNFEEEHPTAAQLQSLQQLTSWYARHLRIPRERIGVHKDYAATLCPGRNLEYYLPWIRRHAR